MPSTISLNVVNSDSAGINSLYATVPASRTIYAQTLVNYIKDSRFASQLAPDSIPISKLQALDSTKIQDKSLSGAVNQPIQAGQIAWYSINSYNIAPGGIETANLKDDAVTRAKLADGSVFLEHFTDASISEFANKIATGDIANKINRAGDTMTGTLAVKGTTGGINKAAGIEGVSFEVLSDSSKDDAAHVAVIIGNNTVVFYPEGTQNGKNAYFQVYAPSKRSIIYTGTAWRYIDHITPSLNQVINSTLDYPWLVTGWTGKTFSRISAASTSDAAYMTFHRPWKYAVRLGLDTDNKFKIGGWSLGDVAYEIINADNFDTYIGSSTKLSSDYVQKSGATMAGNLSVRQNSSTGFVSLNSGTTSLPGYVSFHLPNGTRAGYIGWSSSTNTLDIKSENGYTFNFVNGVKVEGTNILSESVLESTGVGAITLNGTTSTYQSDTVEATHRTNTYLALAPAGSSNDWAYLRQIGGSNSYHLALDFHDDGDDTRFSIRGVKSANGPLADEVTTRLAIDSSSTTLYNNLYIEGGHPSDIAGETVVRLRGTMTGNYHANRLVFGDQLNGDRYWMGTRGTLDGSNAKFILYYYNTEGSTNNYQQVLEISPTTLNSKSYSLNLKDGALKIDSSNNTTLNGTLTMGHYLELKSKVDDNSDVRMEVGTGRVNGNSNASTNAYIDLISDISTGSSDTSDYGLRVAKWMGVSGDAGLFRKGGVPQSLATAGKLRLVNDIGEVWIESHNNDQRSGVVISTKNTPRLYINADGKADFKGNTVTGVITPVEDSDAVNKAYVDSLVSASQNKSAIRSQTYNNAQVKADRFYSNRKARYQFTCYSGNTYSRYVLEGERIALAIPEGSYTANEYVRLFTLVDMLDEIYEYNLLSNNNVHPQSYSNKEFNGKMVILVVDTSIFGFGAAIVGYKGIEILKSAWDFYYNDVIKDSSTKTYLGYNLGYRLSLLSIFTYEFYRCFFYGVDKLEWDLAKGGVTTGFAVTMRKITMDALGYKGSLYFDKNDPNDVSTATFSIMNHKIHNFARVWIKDKKRNFYNSYISTIVAGSAAVRVGNKVTITLDPQYMPETDFNRLRDFGNYAVGDVIEVIENNRSNNIGGKVLITEVGNTNGILTISYIKNGSALERDTTTNYSLTITIYPPNIYDLNDYVVTINRYDGSPLDITTTEIYNKKTKLKVDVSSVPIYSQTSTYNKLDLVRDSSNILYVCVKDQSKFELLGNRKDGEVWSRVGFNYLRTTDAFASIMFEMQEKFGVNIFTRFFKNYGLATTITDAYKSTFRGIGYVTDLGVRTTIDNLCIMLSKAAGCCVYDLLTEDHKLPVSRSLRAQLIQSNKANSYTNNNSI